METNGQNKAYTMNITLEHIYGALQDSVRFYPLCAACRERTETVGSPRPEEPALFLI